MEEQSSSPGEMNEHAALLYGMQRSGSNYTAQLLISNFQQIRFYNQIYSRCLPTHKHFRLYEEKSIITSRLYYNTFSYRTFEDFKQHIREVSGKEIKIFIICIKDPHSWYLSFMKHARKNKIPYFKKSLNTHFLMDYNHFYRRWLDFSLEAPEEVLFIRYEDLIEDLAGTLDILGSKLKLKRASSHSLNPLKVPMSREFTGAKALFYRERKFLDLIDDQDKKVIQHLIDQELMARFNYQIRL
jgi:hypothetical protein